VHDVTAIDLATKATVHVPYLVTTRNRNVDIENTYKGVTAVIVSQDFFDKTILPARAGIKQRNVLMSALKLRDGMVDNIRARHGLGPGWSSIFIFRDGKMHVALHHSMLPVSRGALRAAVEARWRAFGEKPAASDVSELR
jgi:hypothetical protein